MILWIDAQISPHLASWIHDEFGIEAFSARFLGLLEASDHEIFFKARDADACVMTKDRDFLPLLEEHEPPPKILWITCGNTSTAHLKNVLSQVLRDAIDLLETGQPLVEITDTIQ